MDKVLLNQNRHWFKEYDIAFERDCAEKLKKYMSLQNILVLQGIRRSGKSTLMKILINHLTRETDTDSKEILYLNLDDPYFIEISKEPSKLNGVVLEAEKLTQKKIKYLFLDEVQSVTNWEKYVKTAYDNTLFKKIIITGSNSSLLDGGLAKLLSGRYISAYVYPLSFSEIIKINNIRNNIELSDKLPFVLSLIDSMMKYGSFPEVYKTDKEFKRDIIAAYYETILLKDCAAEGGIRDIKSFKELTHYLLTNMTALYSYSSLSKAVGLHDKSAKEYIGLIENAYLGYEVKQFSFSLKVQNSNKKKLYYADNGFYRLAFDFSRNIGKLFENLVFTELIKAGYEIFHHNDNAECDFILKKDNELTAVQVCYELNANNRQRELKALSNLSFDVTNKYIITYNNKETIENIKVLPFYNFFFKQ